MLPHLQRPPRIGGHMTRWELTLEIPLAKPLPSGTNLREHPMARHKRVKALRAQTNLHLRARGAAFLREWRVLSGNAATRIAVTMTRIGPRELDAHDNLRSSFKAVVDQTAEVLGLSDRSARIDWLYAQERGAPAYRIRLEVLTAEVTR